MPRFDLRVASLRVLIVAAAAAAWFYPTHGFDVIVLPVTLLIGAVA